MSLVMIDHQETRTGFAIWLENEMRAQGIDSKTLALSSGFNYTYIRRLLKDRKASFNVAKKIGEKLGKPKEALIAASFDPAELDQPREKKNPKELYPIFVYLNWLNKIGLYDQEQEEIIIKIIVGFYNWHLENHQIKKSFINEFSKRFGAELSAINNFPNNHLSCDPLTSRIADFVLKQPSPRIYSDDFSKLEEDIVIRSALFYTRIIRKTDLNNGIELQCPFVFLPFRLLRPFFDPWINLTDIEMNFGLPESKDEKVITFFNEKHTLFNNISQSEKDAIVMMAKYSVEYLWDLLNIGYEPLRTSEDFYDTKVIYNLSRTVYVFSTTSGLFIPEEYYGALLAKHLNPLKTTSEEDIKDIRYKNPLRYSYFIEGIFHGLKHGCNINYQLDNERTKAMVLSGQKKFHQYREKAVEILSKYLASNNLEISAGSFEKDSNLEFDWRNWLTIVSDKFTVLSARQSDTKTLAHGLIIESDLFNKILPSNLKHKSIIEIAEYLYNAGKKKVLKEKSEIDGKIKAQEIIDKL